jgi:hypothetical protein
MAVVGGWKIDSSSRAAAAVTRVMRPIIRPKEIRFLIIFVNLQVGRAFSLQDGTFYAL